MYLCVFVYLILDVLYSGMVKQMSSSHAVTMLFHSIQWWSNKQRCRTNSTKSLYYRAEIWSQSGFIVLCKSDCGMCAALGGWDRFMITLNYRLMQQPGSLSWTTSSWAVCRLGGSSSFIIFLKCSKDRASHTLSWWIFSQSERNDASLLYHGDVCVCVCDERVMSSYLSLKYFSVHAVVGLKYLLCFLLRPEEEFTQET